MKLVSFLLNKMTTSYFKIEKINKRICWHFRLLNKPNLFNLSVMLIVVCFRTIEKNIERNFHLSLFWQRWWWFRCWRTWIWIWFFWCACFKHACYHKLTLAINCFTYIWWYELHAVGKSVLLDSNFFPSLLTFTVSNQTAG